MRADVYLAEHGFAKSRQNAKVLIEKGSVTLDGKTVKKPSENVDENTEHKVDVTQEKFVCRGGLKLEGALDSFGFDPSGLVCIDIGASTGGFTDCLLSRGAVKVYSVDAGHGQLDPSLASRDDVVNVEGYNARYLSRADFPVTFDLAVMDVSFISQTYIHRGICDVLKCDGVLISLIKPQFEAGRAAIGKNGIVRRPEDRAAAIERVLSSAEEVGLFCTGLDVSPIEGGDGNTEYLAIFRRDGKRLIGKNEIKAVCAARKVSHG